MVLAHRRPASSAALRVDQWQSSCPCASIITGMLEINVLSPILTDTRPCAVCGNSTYENLRITTDVNVHKELSDLSCQLPVSLIAP